MKKILMLLFACIAITVQAQVLSYRTTAFYSSENTSYGWTTWSSPQSSNIYMQIDWDNALVYIDSNYRQLYQIVKVTGRYRDSDNSEICEMKVIDQDGDRGTMKLAIRPNGKSQIYIIFSNVRWCYDVVRL